MEDHKEKRDKSLRTTKTSSTSTGESTTPRKAEGEAPPYTMLCNRTNQTYYPLQVNLHQKKGSTHEFRTEWLRRGDEITWDQRPVDEIRRMSSAPPHPSPLGAALVTFLGLVLLTGSLLTWMVGRTPNLP